MSKESKRLIRKAAEEAYAVKAKDIHAQATLRVEYYKAYLWRLFLGSVKIEIPRNWSPDYFRFSLFMGGCVAVTKLNGVVIPGKYTTETKNVWKYPVDIMSADDVKFGKRTVGKDAEIIYLESAEFGTPFPSGVESMISIYAEKLACCDGSIDMNLLVSRTPWLAEAENVGEANDLKLMFTKIMDGEPAIFFRRKKSEDMISKREAPFTRLPVKENYVASDIQHEKRQIIEEFLTAIGVNNANTDKRERLITNEVDSNNAELRAAIALWQDNVNRCITNVKAMFGEDILGDLSVKFGAVNPAREEAAIYDESNRLNGTV